MHTLHRWRGPVVLILAALLPFLLNTLDLGFYTSVATRILIYALAVTSLNLVLGLGGMASLGHAAFFGLGAYVVAILGQYGFSSVWIVIPAAILLSAFTGLLIGAVCVRTSGAYFIMITLAFAQMLYYLMVSLNVYGGDDGLALTAFSRLGFGWTLSGTCLYLSALAGLGATIYFFSRLEKAPFGYALFAIRENPLRAEALGYPVYRLKLLCFTLGAALAGLAGALLVNLNKFVSPATLSWHQSGVLMIMVVLGGTRHRYGGVLGAAAYLLIEEILSSHTAHRQLYLGLFLLAAVLSAPQGLAGLWPERNGRRAS